MYRYDLVYYQYYSLGSFIKGAEVFMKHYPADDKMTEAVAATIELVKRYNPVYEGIRVEFDFQKPAIRPQLVKFDERGIVLKPSETPET